MDDKEIIEKGTDNFPLRMLHYRFRNKYLPLMIMIISTLIVGFFMGKSALSFWIISAIVLALAFCPRHYLQKIAFAACWPVVIIAAMLVADHWWSFLPAIAVAYLFYFFVDTLKIRRFGIGISRKTGIALASVFCLVFIVFQVMNIIGSRSLASTIMEAKRLHYPLNSEELNKKYQKRISPERNGGPLLLAACKIMSGQIHKEEWVTDCDLILLGQADHYFDRPYTEAELLNIEKKLDSLAPTLHLVDQALAYPQLCIPLKFPKDDQIWYMELPHLSLLMTCSKVFALQAYYYQHQGKVEQAIKAIEKIFQIGKILRQEPLIISQLVATAIHKRGLNAVAYLIYKNAGKAEDWQKLQAYITPFCQLQKWNMKSELLFNYGLAHSSYLRLPSWERFRHHWTREFLPKGSLVKILGYLLVISKGQLKNDIVLGMRINLDAMELINKSEAEVRKGLDHWEKINSFRYPISSLMVPSWNNVLDKELERLALARCVQAALDIKVRQAQTATFFPDSSFVRDYLDPFSGKSLLFCKTEKGCIIYSMGKNRIDDKGNIGLNDYRSKNRMDVGVALQK